MPRPRKNPGDPMDCSRRSITPFQTYINHLITKKPEIWIDKPSNFKTFICKKDTKLYKTIHQFHKLYKNSSKHYIYLQKLYTHNKNTYVQFEKTKYIDYHVLGQGKKGYSNCKNVELRFEDRDILCKIED